MSFSSTGTFDGFGANSSVPLLGSSGDESGSTFSNSNNTSPNLDTDASHFNLGIDFGMTSNNTSSVGAGLPWPLQTHHLHDSQSQSPKVVAQPYPHNPHFAYSTPQPTYGLTHATPTTPLNTHQQAFAKPWPVTPSRILPYNEYNTPGSLYQSPGQSHGPLDRHSTLTPLIGTWNTDASPIMPTPGRVPGPNFTGTTANSGANIGAGPSTPRKRLSLSAASSPHNQYSPYAYPGSAGSHNMLPNGRPARPRVSLPPMPSVHMPTLSSSSVQMRGGMSINGLPSYVSPIHPLSYGMRMHPAPSGFEFEGVPDGKPSRFKPTKAQLELLIDSYDRNQVPDAEERKRLRSLLGPDIKAKTIQIWFQNRRSKSRTKERQAAAKRAFDGNEDDASGSGGESKSDGQLDRESTTGAQDIEGPRLAQLRQLIRDDSTAVPIEILSVGAWTRFLTPGNDSPDLGMSYTLHDSSRSSTAMTGYTSPISPSGPAISFYITHAASSYGVSIPLQSVQASLRLSQLTSPTATSLVSNDPKEIKVVLGFTLPPGVASFAYWKPIEGWCEIDDFSGGAVRIGGEVEVTGGQELSRAYKSLSQHSILPLPFPFYRTSIDGSYSHSSHASISSVSSFLSGPYSAIEPSTVNPFTMGLDRPALLHTASHPANLFPALQTPTPGQQQPHLNPVMDSSPTMITPRAGENNFPCLLPSAMPGDSPVHNGIGASGNIGAAVESGSDGSAAIDPFSLTMPLSMSPEGSAFISNSRTNDTADGDSPVNNTATWSSGLALQNDTSANTTAAPELKPERADPILEGNANLQHFDASASAVPSPDGSWSVEASHDFDLALNMAGNSMGASSAEATGVSGQASPHAGIGGYPIGAMGAGTGNWHSYVQGLQGGDQQGWLEASR